MTLDELRPFIDDIIRLGIRAATRTYHPDAGGSHEQMLALQQAAVYLRRCCAPPSAQLPLRFRHTGVVELPDTRCIRTTTRALLCDITWMAPPARLNWVPKSHVDPASDVWKVGDEGTLRVSAWLAQQRGWHT